MAKKVTPEKAEMEARKATEAYGQVMGAPNGLSLREGPHMDYKRLAVLDNGFEVEILDLPGQVQVPGWSLVTAKEWTGWVMNRFLRVD